MAEATPRPADEPKIPDGADPKIIEQMRKDGIAIPGEETLEKKPEPAKPEPDKKEDDDPSKKPEPKAGKENEEDEEPDQPDRPIRTIPAWKHKDMLKDMERKHKEELASMRDDFDAKLKMLSEKPPEKRQEESADVQDLADEFGIAPEAISKLADRIANKVRGEIKLPEDVSKKLEAFQERERELLEEKGFETEWAATAEAIKKDRKDISDAELSAVKAKIKEFAYTEPYARYRLTDIVRLEAGNLFTEKGKKSAEPGRGGSQFGDKVTDYSKITEDDIKNMSSQDFERYSEFMAKQGSRYSRITRAPRIP